MALCTCTAAVRPRRAPPATCKLKRCQHQQGEKKTAYRKTCREPRRHSSGAKEALSVSSRLSEKSCAFAACPPLCKLKDNMAHQRPVICSPQLVKQRTGLTSLSSEL